MYTSIKGNNDRLKLLLARNANMGLQTTAPGPYMGFEVPKKYSAYNLDTIFGEDNNNYDQGFT